MTRAIRSIPGIPTGLIIAGICGALFVCVIAVGLVLGVTGRAG